VIRAGFRLEDELLAQSPLSLSPARPSCSCSRPTLTQLFVGRPVRLVEGPPCGVYRAVHVRLRRVGDLAEHLFGGPGLMLVKVPASPSTSLPSIIIFLFEANLWPCQTLFSLS